MHDEWPDYLYEAGEAAASTLRPETVRPETARPDRVERWNELCLAAALEHLSQRREQVYVLRRRLVICAALALVEGGVLLGLLLRYLSG